jgi:hypothetical protein
MNKDLIKRLKSLGWRLLAMLVAVSINFMLENLTELQLSESTTVVLGLILGEVSKQLNNNYKGV